MNGSKENTRNKKPFIIRILGQGKSYFVKTPWWLKKMYPHRHWDVVTKEKNIYLSFDDGPHPAITPFVLDELKKYNAKATFFCIGKNVEANPGIYNRIRQEGHSTGNHTFRHLNGWQTDDDRYLEDISLASRYIDTDLFRPPYGRMRSSQAKRLGEVIKNKSPKIIMWSVLSGDFDEMITAKKCLSNVTANSNRGSIIVFHDSEKAGPILKQVLPEALRFFSAKGYHFKQL